MSIPPSCSTQTHNTSLLHESEVRRRIGNSRWSRDRRWGKMSYTERTKPSSIIWNWESLSYNTRITFSCIHNIHTGSDFFVYVYLPPRLEWMKLAFVWNPNKFSCRSFFATASIQLSCFFILNSDIQHEWVYHLSSSLHHPAKWRYKNEWTFFQSHKAKNERVNRA